MVVVVVFVLVLAVIVVVAAVAVAAVVIGVDVDVFPSLRWLQPLKLQPLLAIRPVRSLQVASTFLIK